jgi:hypothetical protein
MLSNIQKHEKIMTCISKMVDTIELLKDTITSQQYIDLYNNLMDIYKHNSDENIKEDNEMVVDNNLNEVIDEIEVIEVEELLYNDKIYYINRLTFRIYDPETEEEVTR